MLAGGSVVMETHEYRGGDKKGKSPSAPLLPSSLSSYPAPPLLLTPTPTQHKHTPVAMMTTLWIIDRHGLLYITAYRENSTSEQIAPTTLCCNTFSGSAPAAARSQRNAANWLQCVFFFFFPGKCGLCSVVTFAEQQAGK